MFNHSGSQPNARAMVVHKGAVGDSALGCLSFSSIVVGSTASRKGLTFGTSITSEG